MLGVDPWRYLDCKDPAQAAVMTAVIDSAEEFLDRKIDELAYKLAKATWGGV